MKKWIAFVLALNCGLTLIACNKQESKSTLIFQAEIVSIYEDIMLVALLDGCNEAELEKGTAIGITIHDLPNSDELKVGDIVEITYSELVTTRETPSANGVEKIVVIKPTL